MLPVIDQAVNILRGGGLVAIPTETVYGHGADATNPLAVQRIFIAKGRPSTNPLIVHVADVTVAKRYATRWPPIADRLAELFWPGPLTLLLPKSKIIGDEVTAGRKTVGIRVPNHPIALQLLKAFDGPIAAPSANRANHISPTRAQHVRDELGDRVDLILDGGPCIVGIESTVLDLTTVSPRILRPGGVSRQQLESAIGPVDLVEATVDPLTPAASPGQHARHYSPVTATFRFNSDEREAIARREGSIAIIIGSADFPSQAIVRMADEPAAYAQQLYQALREADAKHPTAIYVEMPPNEPRWSAVRDRLMRATAALRHPDSPSNPRPDRSTGLTPSATSGGQSQPCANE